MNRPQGVGRASFREPSEDDDNCGLELSYFALSRDVHCWTAAFMADFNQWFGRPARNDHDAHRPLRPDDDLREIFTSQDTRKVTRSLTLHYKRVMYRLDKTAEAPRVSSW